MHCFTDKVGAPGGGDDEEPCMQIGETCGAITGMQGGPGLPGPSQDLLYSNVLL